MRLSKVQQLNHMMIWLDHNALRSDILSTLSKYRDLFLTRAEIGDRLITRDAVTLHALNHVFK